MTVEIKLKPRQLHPTSKGQKSTSGNSGGTGGKKHKVTNGVGAAARQKQSQADRDKTEANKMVLLLLPSGKRRFVRLSSL